MRPTAPRPSMASAFQELTHLRFGSLWLKLLALIFSWACLTGILIAVGAWVTHSSAVNALDRHVTSVVVAHRTPSLDSVMKVVTWLGSWVALVTALIVLAVLVLIRRLPVAALVVALVAWAGESGGVTLAKYVVQRPRPPPDLRLVSAHGWSWPSGHTAVAIVTFVTLALLATSMLSDKAYPTLVWTLAALIVTAVAFSRIELGVHWSTDVLASALFATAWLVVLASLFASHIHPPNIGAQRPQCAPKQHRLRW